MTKSNTFKINFVCLGNICRSPLAQGVFQHLVVQEGLTDKIKIASAGTGNWHVGAPPDQRMSATAKRNGIQLINKAKQFQSDDYENFDLVLAMDQSNFNDLISIGGSYPVSDQLKLFRSFDPEANGDLDVPDPYYGGSGGFDEVFNIVHRTCPEVLKFAKSRLTLFS
ncbi:MAG: low molecular weight protein-tyrosine-phosphatase [Nitrospinales bacterium]